MSSQSEDEVIHIILTIDDVKDIAADNDIRFDTAIKRAKENAQEIERAATRLIWDHLESAIVGYIERGKL